jgi:hypothetical protein
MQPIEVGRPVVEGNRVTAPVRAGSARGYVRDVPFWVEYQGLDGLEELDDGLLAIPALGTLLTVGYALGVPVAAHRVDSVYAEAAVELAGVFGGMYPSFRHRGFALHAEHAEPRRTGTDGGALLLFSGGVDSTSSLLAHQCDVRDLFVVWGADVPLGDTALWDQLSARLTSSPLTRDRDLLVARSNLHEVVDGLRLTRKFRSELHGANWWGAVQHGLALSSLAIPAAACRGRDVVYVAATDTVATGTPWGSGPHVDGRVRWAGGRVSHDQYDLTRQDKLARIIGPYVADGGRLALAVCYQVGRGAGGVNCGRCEKCLRTISGLLAAGVPPERCGLPVDAAVLDRAPSALAATPIDSGNIAYWHDIQAAVPADLGGSQAPPPVRRYLQWLRTADLPVRRPPNLRQRWKHDLRYGTERLLRHLPSGVRRAVNRRRFRARRWLG